MHIRKFFAFSALTVGMALGQQPGQTQPPRTGQAEERTGTGNTRTGTTERRSDPAAGTETQRTRQTGAQAGTLGKQDHNFLMNAAKSNMMEIQVAQMAQQKAASDEVKEYARQLEQDHKKANEKLKQIAQERGVDLPSDASHDKAMHEKKADTKAMSQLQNLSGEQFDRAFMRMQVQHHKKDINSFRKYSKNSMDTDLRQFATATLPTLEQHLQQAQSLANQTGTRGRQQPQQDRQQQPQREQQQQ